MDPRVAEGGTLLTPVVLASHPQDESYPVDSADEFVDSTDATRSYPQDSTDETNNS